MKKIILLLIFSTIFSSEQIYNNSLALIIGINDYQNIGRLNYAANDNFVLVKNGNHFRISNDVDQSGSQGILYGALLAAYFYKPLGGKGSNGVYESNQRITGRYTPNKYADAGQTHTWTATTEKGKKIAEKKRKAWEAKKKAVEAEGKVTDLIFSLTTGEQLPYNPKQKNTLGYGTVGYINERDNLDVFYGARIRGPLGLY